MPHIRKVFAEEGIPQDLAYVALVESASKTNALSRAKAKGVWQFISATGKRYGLDQDWWVDERSDPDGRLRHLLTLDGLSREEIVQFLDLAQFYVRRPGDLPGLEQ